MVKGYSQCCDKVREFSVLYILDYKVSQRWNNPCMPIKELLFCQPYHSEFDTQAFKEASLAPLCPHSFPSVITVL